MNNNSTGAYASGQDTIESTGLPWVGLGELLSAPFPGGTTEAQGSEVTCRLSVTLPGSQKISRDLPELPQASNFLPIFQIKKLRPKEGRNLHLLYLNSLTPPP